MASTEATSGYILKNRYVGQRVKNLVFEGKVLLELLAKDTGFSGRNMPLPVITSDPQGLSYSVANAQLGETSAEGESFDITIGEINQVVSVGDKVMKQSRNDGGAFMRDLSMQIDGALNNVGVAMATYIYGNGGNAIGRRLSEASDVVTLTNPEDAVNFHKGMLLNASDTDGTSGAIRVGSTAVTAVDRNAGTITLDISDITAHANNDYYFRLGTHQTSHGANIVYGLDSWLIAGTPSATEFFGVNRSLNSYLNGVYLTTAEVNAMGLEERLLRLCSKITRVGGGPGPTDILLNTSKWMDLSIALQSRGIIPQDDALGRTGHKKLEISTPSGAVSIWGDRFCPVGTAYALHMPSWKLYSMGQVPDFLGGDGGDGLKLLRKATTNDFECRIVAYPQLGTTAPSYSGRCPV